MDKPTKIVRRGDPGAENVTWDYAKCYARDARDGRLLTPEESANADFTQIFYILRYYPDGRIGPLKLYHFYRPKAVEP